jgi:hypothetical protein
MSGNAPSVRSLWFGDGLTSATTQESGRNSDTSTTIRETTHAFAKGRREGSETQACRTAAWLIVQKRWLQTSLKCTRGRHKGGILQ